MLSAQEWGVWEGSEGGQLGGAGGGKGKGKRCKYISVRKFKTLK